MFLTDLNKPEKIINIHWINRSKAFIERMIELDDTWAGGHPHYDRAFVSCLAGLVAIWKRQEKNLKKL